MTNDAPRALTCLIEGESSPFIVTITGSRPIMVLMDFIKEKGINAIEHPVPAKDLTLWKVTGLIPIKPSNTLVERIEIFRNQFPESQFAEVMDPGDSVAEIWPEQPNPKHVHIIVELPSDRAVSSLPPRIDAKTSDLWDLVTLIAAIRGDFGGQAGVDRNKIFELDDIEPDFLVEFRAKLRQRRWVESNTNCVVPGLRGQFDEFDNYFQDAPPGVPGDGMDLLCHLQYALSCKWKGDNVIKEENVWWIFNDLGWYFHSVLGSRERHSFRGDWPFRLIVSTPPSRSFQYTPRSDFHVAVGGLVYLLVQVQSDRNQGDRYQMLQQAACAARLGRKSCNDSFIVVALYIENSGTVTRYFVFQRDGNDPKVSYVRDVQDWTQPRKLFSAIFELYNLVSVIKSNGHESGNFRERIVLLGNEVAKHFKTSFMSKNTHADGGGDAANPRKRLRRGGQGDNADEGLRDGEDVYDDYQVADAITRAGYTLESNEEDENGWVPLEQLKPTMRHAKQSNGTSVVVKLLHPRSNELRILQHLNQIKSRYNHTIPLLGTITVNLRTFVFLHTGTPLDLGFAIGKFRSKVADFSRQLIEGVGFLHHHGIAHLDIKPQNIVASPNQLFIIDFDISVFVDGPNALIDRWCGTPGWMAPEIGHQDGPKRLYSPIRADLWSCGLVLRYLAGDGAIKEENPFEALTRQLLNKNPLRRPLLYQWHSVEGHSLS